MNPTYRVDNRLVHGQIIAAWIPYLRLERLVVASDSVPDNALQLKMFRMAVPPNLEFNAFTLKDAARWLTLRRFGNARTLVLMETPEDALRLFNFGHPFSDLNIGNIHYADDRRRITNAVYLGPGHLSVLGRLQNCGVDIEICSVPTETPINLSDVLGS